MTEKIRTSRQAGEDVDKYIVTYFDYAGDSDVPPKLDAAVRYPMMADVLNLYCHLHGVRWETMATEALLATTDAGDEIELVDRQNNNKLEANQVVSYNGLTVETFTQTQTGSDLLDAIEAAKSFFKENPDWIGEILESADGTPTPSQKTKDPSTEEQEKSGEDKNSDQSRDDEKSEPDKEDPAYEERQKRRMKEKEERLHLVQVSKNGKEKDGNSLDVVDETNNQSGPRNGTFAPLVNGQMSDSALSTNHVQGNGDHLINPPPKEKSSHSRKPPRSISNPKDSPDTLRQEFQLNSPEFNRRRGSATERRRNSTNGSKLPGKSNSDDVIIAENGAQPNEEEQLKEDIDFIHNFGAHQARVRGDPGAPVLSASLPPLLPLHSLSQGQPVQPALTQQPDPIVLDLDLSEYTPPEDFLSLATSRLHSNALDNKDHSTGLGNVNGLDAQSAVAMETTEVDVHNDGFQGHNRPLLVDSNSNKLACASSPSAGHFVIDFVDPSVKQKPDQLDVPSSSV